MIGVIGEERKERLSNAGYNFDEIQGRVNEKMKNNNNVVYKVQKGDTLTSIAKKYNTTWLKIYDKNKKKIGKNPNLIKPNQELIIP